MDKLDLTPEGHKKARELAKKLGKLEEFESVKDSWMQVALANEWLEE